MLEKHTWYTADHETALYKEQQVLVAQTQNPDGGDAPLQGTALLASQVCTAVLSR